MMRKESRPNHGKCNPEKLKELKRAEKMVKNLSPEGSRFVRAAIRRVCRG